MIFSKLTTMLLLLIVASVSAQNVKPMKNREIRDPEKGEPVLIGECNRKGLTSNKVFANYYTQNYQQYKPDIETLKKLLEKKSDEMTIVIVMATWCGDTKKQLPRFYKILDQIKFDESKITMIGVDSKKYAYTISTEEYKVKKIPTFIFYKNGKEKGRIVETPKKSLELDMLKIFRKF